MAPESEPTYLYKILDQPPPEPLPETLQSTDLDAKDGFIHLSSAEQIPITAGLFFAKFNKIWVLKLRRKDLQGRIDHPTEFGKNCPHLHDSPLGLGKSNTDAVIELQRADGQQWKDVTDMSKLDD